MRAVVVRALLLAVAGIPSLAAAATPVDPQAMAQAYGCLACHGLVHKQVGPGFAQIAERYRGDAAKAEVLAQKIRGGSVGTWGRIIMPRQTRVSEADAKELARWVLAQPAP